MTALSAKRDRLDERTEKCSSLRSALISFARKSVDHGNVERTADVCRMSLSLLVIISKLQSNDIAHLRLQLATLLDVSSRRSSIMVIAIMVIAIKASLTPRVFDIWIRSGHSLASEPPEQVRSGHSLASDPLEQLLVWSGYSLASRPQQLRSGCSLAGTRSDVLSCLVDIQFIVVSSRIKSQCEGN